MCDAPQNNPFTSPGVSSMNQLMRFGRRVPLPSTVQIVHELLVAQQNDDARQAKEAKDAAAAGQPGPRTEAIRVPPQA
jgi:hypothetical protein